MGKDLFTQLNQFVKSSRNEFESKLAAIVEIPSVSSSPENRADIDKCGELACAYLRETGAEATLTATPGNPVVFGSLIREKRFRTVTIYNHLDVQPADPSEWHKAPFSFYKAGDRYEGRGTTDDKGPALTALMAVKYAHQNDLPLNFKFIWELEEEIVTMDEFNGINGAAA